jgi:hypothetical protein
MMTVKSLHQVLFVVDLTKGRQRGGVLDGLRQPQVKEAIAQMILFLDKQCSYWG